MINICELERTLSIGQNFWIAFNLVYNGKRVHLWLFFNCHLVYCLMIGYSISPLLRIGVSLLGMRTTWTNCSPTHLVFFCFLLFLYLILFCLVLIHCHSPEGLSRVTPFFGLNSLLPCTTISILSNFRWIYEELRWKNRQIHLSCFLQNRICCCAFQLKIIYIYINTYI